MEWITNDIRIIIAMVLTLFPVKVTRIESSMVPVVRHGKIEDMKVVLDLDELFENTDIFSASYKTYCEDRLRINCILEVDGVAVSYMVATVVDEGEGVVLQAARTHPDHRNKGYQYYLKEAVVKEVKALYPQLKEVLYIPWNPDFELNDKRRVLQTQDYHATKIPTNPANSEIIKEKLESYVNEHSNGSAVQSVEFSKISNYLAREDFRRHFPGNRIIIEWVPYKLDIPSNFSLPNRFPDTFQVTFDKQGLIDGVSFYFIYKDKERDWTLHDIDIYCETEETCLKHYAAFLQGVLKGKACTNIFACALYPNCFGKNTFNATLNESFGFNNELFKDITYVPLVVDNKYFV